MWTGCDLYLQRLSYKLTEKLFEKMTKLKNPNLFLKANIFKNQNRRQISTNSNELIAKPQEAEWAC